jgi:ATP-dependent RNA helicase RhlB
VFNAEEEALLATMSTDERMKLYKEKYGAGVASSATSKSAAQSKPNSKNGGQKNSRRNGSKKPANQNQNARKNGKPKNENPRQNQQAPQKKGLFAKLKSLFGGKK